LARAGLRIGPSSDIALQRSVARLAGIAGRSLSTAMNHKRWSDAEMGAERIAHPIERAVAGAGHAVLAWTQRRSARTAAAWLDCLAVECFALRVVTAAISGLSGPRGLAGKIDPCVEVVAVLCEHGGSACLRLRGRPAAARREKIVGAEDGEVVARTHDRWVQILALPLAFT
jgi:hypothetical protein